MSDKLSKRLKNLRESKGYLQKYVADKIGVKSNTLSGYENGTRAPDPEMIVKLAEFYGVTTDYLLGNSDDPNKTEDEELEEFIDGVRIWYKDAPKTKDEKLKLMKEMFELIKKYWHHLCDVLFLRP